MISKASEAPTRALCFSEKFPAGYFDEMLQVLHGFSIFALSVHRKVYNAYNETPTKGKSMRTLTYEFSVLEPIVSNAEFPDKVTHQIYTTFGSLLSVRRLVLVGVVARLADKGTFKEIGRYRIEIAIIRTKTHVRLSRFV